MKSFTVLGFLIWLHTTVGWGILAFSKQGTFLPSAVWAIGALVAGYRATWKKLAILSLVGIAAGMFLTPVSQIGRNTRYQANSNEIAWDLLSHPVRTRELYLESEKGAARSAKKTYRWYGESTGLLDRLAMFPIDDALIHVTDLGHVRGPAPILARMQNAIPRYLMPGEKVSLRWGNIYAHEIGLLGKYDDSTGISFTPFADAYHCMKFWGLASFFFFALMMFSISDSLTGSTEQTIWATLYISLFSHSAAEGMLATPFSAVTTYAFGAFLAAALGRWVLPYIGGFLLPPKRKPAGDQRPMHWHAPSSASRSPLPSTIEGSI